MANPKPAERKIAPTISKTGNPEWKSGMTAPDATKAVVPMIPDRIIPIIFVPGVMGSNLMGIGAARGINWRLDSNSTMSGWLTRGAKGRKRFLTPFTMAVDNRGMLPDGTEPLLPPEELLRRGWGEVGALSYTEFLVWLENSLNDFNNAKGGLREQIIGMAMGAEKGEAVLTREDVALSYKYRFAVHACGYNWLDDNATSAIRLKQRISAVINRYKNEKRMCEKVILVTHSMGGLVARYCTEILKMSGTVMAVVHGVMPAIGAAAVYRRMKSGTEGAYMAAKVLGEDAAEMTAVLSGAPGPLQLLPTSQYGNGWLRIHEWVDGKKNSVSLPKNGDPYSEVYTIRNKWWSMVDDQRINPLNTEGDETKRQTMVDRDWTAYVRLIMEKVKPFHELIVDAYHNNTHAFYGSHPDYRAFGVVEWYGRDDRSVLGRGDRKSDLMNGVHTNPREVDEYRSVNSKLYGDGWKESVSLRFSISKPDENGDGTVPHRSGIAPMDNPQVKSMLKVRAGHEPAYRESMEARRFTLRAIVQIAREINKTGLSYSGT